MKKSKLAISLKYNENTDDAPLISAMGQRSNAELMKSIARRYAIPIEDNKILINELSKLDDGQEIPENLYHNVACLFNK